MKKAVTKVVIFCLAALLLILPLVGACEEEPAAESIKIGVLGPMDYEQGFRLIDFGAIAVDEINDAGGVLVGEEQRPLELVTIDTNEVVSVPDAVSAIERAILVEKCDFLIGGYRSEAVVAMQEVAADHNMVFLGIGAADTTMTTRVTEDYDRYKGFFRIMPFSSPQIGNMLFLETSFIVAQVKEALGVETLKAAIVCPKVMWVDPVAAAGEAVLPNYGVEVVGTYRPSATAQDLTAEVTDIKAKGAHLIWLVSHSPMDIPLAKAIADLNVPVAVLGADGMAHSEAFWESTDGKCEYLATMVQFAPDVGFTSKGPPFVEECYDRYGIRPTVEGGIYDALYMLKEAIERAGTLDSDAVVAELENTDYQGAAGRYVFDESHEITWAPGYITGGILEWYQGEPRWVWPAEWPGCPEEFVGISYPGIEEYIVPPRVIDYWTGQ